jgi:hypothetical protein
MGMEGVYIYLLIIDRDHHQLASEEKSRRRWNLRDFIDGWIVIIYILVTRWQLMERNRSR